MPKNHQVPDVVDENGQELFIVEKIVAKRTIKNGVLQYRVKWKNYNNHHNQWRKADEIIETCGDAIDEFEYDLEDFGGITMKNGWIVVNEKNRTVREPSPILNDKEQEVAPGETVENHEKQVDDDQHMADDQEQALDDIADFVTDDQTFSNSVADSVDIIFPVLMEEDQDDQCFEFDEISTGTSGQNSTAIIPEMKSSVVWNFEWLDQMLNSKFTLNFCNLKYFYNFSGRIPVVSEDHFPVFSLEKTDFEYIFAEVRLVERIDLHLLVKLKNHDFLVEYSSPSSVLERFNFEEQYDDVQDNIGKEVENLKLQIAALDDYLTSFAKFHKSQCFIEEKLKSVPNFAKEGDKIPAEIMKTFYDDSLRKEIKQIYFKMGELMGTHCVENGEDFYDIKNRLKESFAGSTVFAQLLDKNMEEYFNNYVELYGFDLIPI